MVSSGLNQIFKWVNGKKLTGGITWVCSALTIFSLSQVVLELVLVLSNHSDRLLYLYPTSIQKVFGIHTVG